MTNAARITRAMDLEAKAINADRRWPDSPSIARNLRWAARHQRARVARACSEVQS